jgi:uncharacterized membrane protein
MGTGSVYSSRGVTAGLIAAFAAVFVVLAVWSGGWYQTWKALHVLMAIVWVGGALYVQLLAFRILRENEPARLERFSKDVEAIGIRTFLPASLLLVVLGFVLMSNGDWPYTFWVVFAIGVWLFSFVLGAFFLGPESGRVGALIEERGGVDGEIRARIERILLYSRIDLVVLALAAMDMVLKPGA